MSNANFDYQRQSYESWPWMYGKRYDELSQAAATPGASWDNLFWALFAWVYPFAKRDAEFLAAYAQTCRICRATQTQHVAQDHAWGPYQGRTDLSDADKWSILMLCNEAAFRAKTWTRDVAPTATEPGRNGGGGHAPEAAERAA